MFKPGNISHVMLMDEWMIVNVGRKCIQNLFWNTSTFLEQPLLLYIIVTGVWSKCNIFVCYLCTGNWCIFIVFVMCENTDITWLYVLPVDCHIVVSVCCTVLVIKSQGMQQLMYNCSMPYASIALEVELLSLWVIENLWLTVARQERHLLVREDWSWLVSVLKLQQGVRPGEVNRTSVFPVICGNQQCQNVQGDGQRP